MFPMKTKYKYEIIKGEQDPFTDIIQDESFEKHIPNCPVGFNGKKYRVIELPTKGVKDDFGIVKLEQID